MVIETGELGAQGPAAWALDSGELAFSALEGSRSDSIYQVPRTGGTPTRIARCRSRTDSGCELDWSPDGTMLAVADRWPGNSELYLLYLASSRRRDLIKPDKLYVTTPRFSPDGKWIAYLKQPSMTSDDIYVVAAAARHAHHAKPRYLRGFASSTDGNSMLAVSSRRSSTKVPDVAVPVGWGKPYRVGVLDSGRGSARLCRARKDRWLGLRLSSSSLWRMPVDRSGTPPEPLTTSAAADIDAEWSSNGRICFAATARVVANCG